MYVRRGEAIGHLYCLPRTQENSFAFFSCRSCALFPLSFLHNCLHAFQTAVRTLKSTSGEKARYSKAALDGMRGSLVAAQARLGEMKTEKDAALQSLLEVAQMRTSPSRQTPSQPCVEGREQGAEQQQQDYAEHEREDSFIGSSGGGAYGHDRNSDTPWSLVPDCVAGHRNDEELRVVESTQVPCDEGSEGLMGETDLDRSSCVGAPGGTSPRNAGGPAAKPAAGRRRNDYRETWGDVGWASSSGTGEHVCRVCGAPAPSFRKLFDCRLSLDRARAEAAEARAREAVNEEGAASEIRKVMKLRFIVETVDYGPGFLNYENAHGPFPRLNHPVPFHDSQSVIHRNHQHSPDNLRRHIYLARKQAQSTFAAIRERLEQRLAMESAAVSSRLGESRESSATDAERTGEARGREAATRDGEVSANTSSQGLFGTGLGGIRN